ncbi:serine/threonine protein kinase [Candidatus Uabimicrobium amorphum]|uniref:non-specific serine/threonine protein kinase n=1 Tax=Uabimicrobium amorphum TaxID=2596890 RepID=A0A5S9IPD2_UABAM|nr:WD40 repeat domain-containing serine/threonine protein kinase [Candidatus Uabimicrobium amorphum]BBM84235.1 serine/threonine-protein kinase PknB [Candidatus Uabimicrobium amorphum]
MRMSSDYRIQALVYFLRYGGVLSSSQLQQIQLQQDLVSYIRDQKILSEQQWYFFDHFYHEYLIVTYARQKNVISQQQFHDILLRKMQLRTASLLSTEVPIIENNLRKILIRLEEEKLITSEENVQLQQQCNSAQREKSKKFNHYVLEEELGRGGMGVVYKALDTNLNRYVALKIIRGDNAQQEDIMRFMRESKAVAQLDHPNIVRIFEMGKVPENYYTMEYIEGMTLHSAIHDQQITIREVVKIISDIARALESAHQKNIIHRDIKPANIMLANKTPKLMDFGLVKMDSGASLSKTGDIIGTIFYMSPEQVETITLTDNRSDIYSLGATLYEALVGRPPFQGQTHINVIHQIAYDEPISLRKLNPDIAAELEAICLKCLEKKPTLRYQNAMDLAEDLINFSRGLPVSARPANFVKKTYRWCKRHYTFTFISLAFVVFLVSIFYLNKRNNDELNRKNEKLVEITKQLEHTNNSLRTAKKQQEVAFVESQERLVDAHLKMTDVYLERFAYTQAQSEINKAQQILQLPIMSKISRYQKYCAQTDIYQKYAIAPHLPRLTSEWALPHQQRCFVSSRGRYIAFIVSGEIRYWDLKTSPQNFFSIPCTANTFLCFSKSEKYLFYLHDRKIYRYFFQDKTSTMLSSVVENFVEAAANENWLALYYRKGKKRHVKLFDIQRQEFKDVLSSSAKVILHMTPSYFVGNDRFQVKIMDLVSGKEQLFYHLGNRPSYMCLANQQDLFMGDNAGNIYIYDTGKLSSKNNVPTVIKAQKDKVRNIQFSKDLQFFATMDNSGVYVWDYTTRNKILSLPLLKPVGVRFCGKNTLRVFFHKDNKFVVQDWNFSPLFQKTLELDKNHRGKFTLVRQNVQQIDSFSSNPVTFSRNNKFAAISYASSIVFWNLKTNRSYTFSFSILTFGTVDQIMFSEDETKAFCLSEYGKLVIVDMENMQHPRYYDAEFEQDSVICLLNKQLLLVAGQKRLRLYNISTKKLQEIAKLGADIFHIKLSPDKKHLAILQEKGFEIWQLQNSTHSIRIVKKTTVAKRQYWFRSQIVWHPASEQIVSSTARDIQFYRRNGKNTWVNTHNIVHDREVKRLGYSRKGKYLAVHNLHNTAVYDVKNNVRVLLYPGYAKGISANFDRKWQYFAFPDVRGGIFLFHMSKGQK